MKKTAGSLPQAPEQKAFTEEEILVHNKAAKNTDIEKLQIKYIYNSIKDAPSYPKGFNAVKGGTKKVNINNQEVLESLRSLESGKWMKVYKNGYDVSGNQISIHYFQSESGKVFNVKVKDAWSIW